MSSGSPAVFDRARLCELAAPLLAKCAFPSSGLPLHCAVSGGPDSMALLLLAVAHGCVVTAHHVDHGLRAESAGEATLVRHVAEALGAVTICRRVQVEHGPNLEARARAARYGVFPSDVATGHTMDDLAETVLLNIVRGSGLDGLAPMRSGSLRRPLLALRRAETRALCDALGVETVDDSMNDDARFARVRVRHEVLPMLNDVADRDVVPLLARLSDVAADDVDALDTLADALEVDDARSLSAAPLAIARRAVRRWLAAEGPGAGYVPSLAVCDRVLTVARGEAVGCEVGEGWQVRRTDQRLRLIPPVSLDP